jgi:hypothetical protein
MSTTFKSWLVANLETATAVILSVIIIPFFVIFAGKYTPVEGGPKVESFFWIFFFLIIIPYALALTPPRLTKSIFAYLLILGICCIYPFFVHDSDTGELIFPTWAAILSLGAFIVVSAASFFIARYAKYNFDEVVSRRMLYRNSSVSLFEIEWRYTIDRFCIATFCILDAIVSIAALIRFLSLV